MELNCKKTSIIVRPTRYEKLIMNITDFDNVIFNGNFVINFVSRLMDVISPTLICITAFIGKTYNVI